MTNSIGLIFSGMNHIYNTESMKLKVFKENHFFTSYDFFKLPDCAIFGTFFTEYLAQVFPLIKSPVEWKPFRLNILENMHPILLKFSHILASLNPS